MPDPADRFDLAVVGGGLVGALAALGAARLGWRVVLIERSAPQIALGMLGHDLRTVAVAPAGAQLFERVGLWGRLTPAPYRAMRIWDARGTATLAFDAEESGRDALGFILENSPTLAVIWEVLAREPGLTLRCPATVTGVHHGADAVSIDLEDGRLKARLLIAADGAQSQVRSALGVPAKSHATGHHALVTVVRTERGHDALARQCFQPEGPVAMLPLVDPGLCSVVWSQPPEAAARRAALDAEVFAVELERALGGRLGAILEVDRRIAFPLQQMLASAFNPLPRVLLIGDAAHVLHPLAGLGANLGFEDVRALLDRLQRLPRDSDPGAERLWSVFARRRHARAALMLRLMSSIQGLYAGADPLAQWLRNSGVHWLNRTLPLKRQIIREAMGLGGFSTGF